MAAVVNFVAYRATVRVVRRGVDEEIDNRTYGQTDEKKCASTRTRSTIVRRAVFLIHVIVSNE